MSATVPHVPARRVVSLLWFPFFFVVSFSLLALLAYAAPAPHGVQVEVVGSATQVETVEHGLSRAGVGGVVVTRASSAAAGRGDLLAAAADAVYVPGPQPRLLVASAGSLSRANSLTNLFDRVSAPTQVLREDVLPSAAGDTSGVSLLFIGLPLLLTGLITALVLLQFAMWSIPTKAAVLAATGGFATVFVYLLAQQLDAVPKDGWLLLYGFLLTQTIGWIATGAASFVRQFFLPVVFTFALVLQLPSAGATVPADMLPAVLRWLNGVMPLAQYIDLARSSAYFGDHGLVGPLLALIGWLLLGAALMTASHLQARRHAAGAEEEATREAEELEAQSGRRPTGDVHGSVWDTSDRPIARAHIVLLDQHRGTTLETETDHLGTYRITDVPVGIHHLLISAPHCEPAAATIACWGTERDAQARNFTLVDWEDPAANLTAEDVAERNALTAPQRHALSN